MRIRVVDVLDLFAAGLDAAQILEEMFDLEKENLQATLQYAARQPSTTQLTFCEVVSGLSKSNPHKPTFLPSFHLVPERFVFCANGEQQQTVFDFCRNFALPLARSIKCIH